MINPLEYYQQEFVKKEIADFSKNRWVALHCKKVDSQRRLIMIRYLNGNPLQISKPSDVDNIFKKFKFLNPRTIYASANLYSDLSRKHSVFDYFHNVIARTPTWDIDSSISLWRITLKAAQKLVNFLEKKGVTKSVYLIWSGNGIHVHIHERAFSDDLYSKIHPIDVGYAIVEYVLQKVRPQINELNRTKNIGNPPIKVENLMDPQRVFTAPLSLHRHLDLATIAFKPEDIENFDISWANPISPRNNPRWRDYISGEADSLAEEAYSSEGSYHLSTKNKKISKYSMKKLTELILDAIEKAEHLNDGKSDKDD
ncbi:MAG: hypothetical protein ACP6IS_06555 [Candidatus Asgardarchaeia archaeon]